mgnify:CR=1 FL=1
MSVYPGQCLLSATSGPQRFFSQRRSAALATTGEIVTYVLSFVAAGARPREEGGSDSRVTDTDEVPFRVQSGNHPNWIHGTYDININLLIKPALP